MLVGSFVLGGFIGVCKQGNYCFSCIRSSDLNESNFDASMEYGVRSKE